MRRPIEIRRWHRLFVCLCLFAVVIGAQTNTASVISDVCKPINFGKTEIVESCSKGGQEICENHETTTVNDYNLDININVNKKDATDDSHDTSLDVDSFEERERRKSVVVPSLAEFHFPKCVYTGTVKVTKNSGGSIVCKKMEMEFTDTKLLYDFSCTFECKGGQRKKSHTTIGISFIGEDVIEMTAEFANMLDYCENLAPIKANITTTTQKSRPAKSGFNWLIIVIVIGIVFLLITAGIVGFVLFRKTRAKPAAKPKKARIPAPKPRVRSRESLTETPSQANRDMYPIECGTLVDKKIDSLWAPANVNVGEEKEEGARLAFAPEVYQTRIRREDEARFSRPMTPRGAALDAAREQKTPEFQMKQDFLKNKRR